MICPECGKGIHMNWEREDYFMGSDNNDGYAILFGTCPVCNKFIVKLKHSLCVKWGSGPDNPGTIDEDFVDLDTIIYPNKVSRHDLDVTIPAKYSSVFREAEAILSISPRASAALSRFLLQFILHEHLNISKRTLEDEIIELEKQDTMPSPFIRKLTLLRKIANFGAHPKKSSNSKELIDVEPGEAEVLLDVLLDFIDIVFVKPYHSNLFEESIKSKYGISID